jgi:putative SOS response-associated peptidase YedK
MCGRYALFASFDDILDRFELRERFAPFAYAPRYNIAPTQPVLAITTSEQGERHLTHLRWGLIPSWAKDPKIGNRMINARAETIREKPSFRRSFERRRCLIIANGFYEWRREGTHKIPIFIRLKSGQPFGFAGLWDLWRSPQGDEVPSCTIITTEANELMKPIHDRMPVILPKAAESAWLDPEQKGGSELTELLTAYPSEKMEAYPVSPRVNSPQAEGPECIEPTSKFDKIREPSNET